MREEKANSLFLLKHVGRGMYRTKSDGLGAGVRLSGEEVENAQWRLRKREGESWGRENSNGKVS